MKNKKTYSIGIGGGIAFVAAILFVGIYFDLQEEVIQFLAWVEASGVWAHILFIVLYVLVVLLLVPGVLFTTGAGFIFGTIRGSLYVILGTTLGATAAFLLARFVLQSWTNKKLEEHPKLLALDQAIAERPWQIVLLTRLIPFFPFKASNYVFGVMQISCWHFVLGTTIGIIPITLTNVYAGSLAGDLAQLQASARTRTPLEWALYGMGLIALLLFFAVVSKLAHAKLHAIQHQHKGPEDQREGPP